MAALGALLTTLDAPGWRILGPKMPSEAMMRPKFGFTKSIGKPNEKHTFLIPRWLQNRAWGPQNRFKSPLGRSMTARRASWGDLGASWGDLGASYGDLAPILGVLGRSWGDLGASWGRSWASWGGHGAILGGRDSRNLAQLSATHRGDTEESAVRARSGWLPIVTC